MLWRCLVGCKSGKQSLVNSCLFQSHQGMCHSLCLCRKRCNMPAAGGIDLATFHSAFFLPNLSHSKGKEMAMTILETRLDGPGHSCVAALLTLCWVCRGTLSASSDFKPLQSSNTTLLLLIPFLSMSNLQCRTKQNNVSLT